MGANISSISASVIVIGGQKPRVSPMAAADDRALHQLLRGAGADLSGRAKPAFERCGASSSPPISRGGRGSPTSGWPASRSVLREARGDGADARGHVLAQEISTALTRPRRRPAAA